LYCALLLQLLLHGCCQTNFAPFPFRGVLIFLLHSALGEESRLFSSSTLNPHGAKYNDCDPSSLEMDYLATGLNTGGRKGETMRAGRKLAVA
jgi:hypothetical protein